MPVDVLLTRGSVETVWVMPDLIGRDFERVRLAFETRGFRIGGVKEQYYEGAAAGTILRQFPLGGYPVSRKDALSFVVAAAEPPRIDS
jgi:beta-lactam-binding protein with PASTA domain